MSDSDAREQPGRECGVYLLRGERRLQGSVDGDGPSTLAFIRNLPQEAILEYLHVEARMIRHLITHILGATAAVAGIVLLAIGLDAAFFIETGEQGLLENAQTLILISAAGVWLWITWNEPSGAIPHSTSELPWNAAAPSIAALAIAGAGREISWGEIWTTSEQVALRLQLISLLVVLVLLFLAFIRWRRTRRQPGLYSRIAHNRAAHLLIYSVVIFLTADAFEKRLLESPYDQLLEEVLEIAAYTCILLAAFVRHKFRLRDR